MSKKTQSTSLLTNASKEVLDLVAKRKNRRAAATKISANEELAPAGKPDLGTEDLGVVVPPELEKVVEEAKAEPQDDLGIVIPPTLGDLTASVVDLDAVEGSEEGVSVDMLPLVPEGAKTVDDILSAGARWIIFANSAPLAEVSLHDQEHKEKVAAHFVTAAFAGSVMNAIEKKGLRSALAEVNARFYVAKVNETKKVKEITASLTAQSEEALRQKSAGVRATFAKSLTMAITASVNNYGGVRNALKDDLVRRIVATGVPTETAVGLVDDAYFAKGEDTVNSILNQAEKFSNTHPDAREQIAEAINATGRSAARAPEMNSPAARNPNYDSTLAASYQNRAVGVVSASVNPLAQNTSISADADEPSSPTDAFRRNFGGFSGRRR